MRDIVSSPSSCFTVQNADQHSSERLLNPLRTSSDTIARCHARVNHASQGPRNDDSKCIHWPGGGSPRDQDEPDARLLLQDCTGARRQHVSLGPLVSYGIMDMHLL